MDEEILEESKVETSNKRYREVTITPGLVGFKVRIGCTELYFDHWNTILGSLTEYYSSPAVTECKYLLADQRMGIDAPQPVAVSEQVEERLYGTTTRRRSGL